MYVIQLTIPLVRGFHLEEKRSIPTWTLSRTEDGPENIIYNPKIIIPSSVPQITGEFRKYRITTSKSITPISGNISNMLQFVMELFRRSIPLTTDRIAIIISCSIYFHLASRISATEDTPSLCEAKVSRHNAGRPCGYSSRPMA